MFLVFDGPSANAENRRATRAATSAARAAGIPFSRVRIGGTQLTSGASGGTTIGRGAQRFLAEAQRGGRFGGGTRGQRALVTRAINRNARR